MGGLDLYPIQLQNYNKYFIYTNLFTKKATFFKIYFITY